MNNSRTLQADWVSPPGLSLHDFIEDSGISLPIAARELDCNLMFLKSFLKGNKKISLDLANRLAHFTGAPTNFWIKREEQYRANLDLVEQRKREEKLWLSELPTADMMRFGWIGKSSSYNQKLKNCFDFFDVTSVDEWRQEYGGMIAETAFRTSENFSHKIESVAAWLRQAELQAMGDIVEPWNVDLIIELIPEMRALSQIESPLLFLPKLRQYLASCGISLAIVPTPKNCPASGAAYWLDDQRALIILSFRYLTDDHFWFTFFHELGHLILHTDYSLILETSASIVSKIESEANRFSEEVLIPVEYKQELLTLNAKNLRGILKLAKKIGISKGIIVGQLQHKEIITREKLNKLKVRYSWKHNYSSLEKKIF